MEHQEHINSMKTLAAIKRYLIKHNIKENKCAICGINEWQNKPLIVEAHHKDGNHLNNNIDNIQFICPNCHSQTEHFRGAGKKKQIPNEEQFINALKGSYSIADAIHKLGMKMGSITSYKYARQIIEKHGITFLKRPSINKPWDPKEKIKKEIKTKTKAPYPDVETMKKLVWEKSLEQLGREWGVQSTAIRLWCARRGIKTPGVGYWRKKATGNL